MPGFHLAANVAAVRVEFLFSNKKIVPLAFSDIPRSAQAAKPVSGRCLVPKTEQVDISALPDILRQAGYVMCAGGHKTVSAQKGVNHLVRFDCIRESHCSAVHFSAKVEHYFWMSFKVLCEDAYWKTMVYLNPFERSGAEVLGLNHININLAGRKGLVGDAGRPILERRIDEYGRRYGDPVALEPSFVLGCPGNNPSEGFLLVPFRREGRVEAGTA